MNPLNGPEWTVPQFYWLVLGGFAVVIVVVAVLLGLIIVAAKRIDRHAGAIWVTGKEIAGNTVAVLTLEQTVGALQRTAESARRIETALQTIGRKARER